MSTAREIMEWAKATAAQRVAAAPPTRTKRKTYDRFPARPRPGSHTGTNAIWSLCQSGDSFDRHDIAEASGGRLSVGSAGSVMSTAVAAGVAEVVVRGWLDRGTLWRGTAKARHS